MHVLSHCIYKTVFSDKPFTWDVLNKMPSGSPHKTLLEKFVLLVFDLANFSFERSIILLFGDSSSSSMCYYDVISR